MVKESKRVSALEPYKITPQDVWVSDSSKIIKSDWNEAPFTLSVYDEVIKESIAHKGLVAWYPDYNATELVKSISAYTGCKMDQILAYGGSDAALCDITNCFLDDGEKVILVSPTYDNFRVYVAQNGGESLDFPLNQDGNLNVEKLREFIKKVDPKIVYIVNPNNPYGTVTDPSSIKTLLEEFDKTLFIIDEAYIDFVLSYSSAKFIAKYKNIIVSRTFSKGFGIAGLRIGYVLAQESIIKILSKIRKGKDITMLGQKCAVHALKNISHIQNWLREIENSKEKFYKFFEKYGIRFYKSYANFILFETADSTRLSNYLKSEHIYVRNRDSILKNHIRITVSSNKLADKIIEIFEKNIQMLKKI
tara:strand:+ start:482 stop:1567 length:1086 start_codon:yes stop_codon:yes gene_type:complete